MKILVTRTLKDKPTFLEHLPKPVEIVEQSFIRIEYCNFQLPQKPFNWIFFSSKNGVRGYLNQEQEIAPHLKVGAVSEATEKFLNEKGVHVHFTGSAHQSTEENARIFAETCQGAVLFPSSDQSLQTFAKYIPPQRTFILEVYKTHLSPVRLNLSFDFYLFTSPSNVLGYHQSNDKIQKGSIVAIGTSTQKELSKIYQKKNLSVSKSTSEVGLAKKVSELYRRN